jgi:two-component system, cell cycle sensor histidine kinase and response regulator CckA
MHDNKSKATAIVVNDDRTQSDILAALLAKSGIESRVFDAAEAALAAMDPNNPPDLVVTDLYMPGIDGWRFCRLLRSPEYAAFNKTPILIVSATFAGDHPERIAANAGADAFLPAPVDGTAFVAQARFLLTGHDARRPPRVLIVEDDTELAHLLDKCFAAHGYQTETAFLIREAEAACRASAYDVAVLDYHLPDGSSDQLLDTFRTVRPDCACLMITGDSSPDLALDWMRRGAAAYLRKPFAPDVLIELCARARRERALLRTEDLLEARTQALIESEMNFRTFYESMVDIVVVATHEGRILFTNSAARNKLGYSGEELSAMHLLDWHRPADRDAAQTIFAAMLSGEQDHCQLPLVTKDGTLLPVDSRVWLGTWSGQDCICGICRDLSAEQEAQQRFELIFRSNPSLMAISSLPERQFMDVNDAFLAVTGYKREDIIGKTSVELGLFVTPETQAAIASDLRSKGSITNREIQMKSKDGSIHDGLFSGEVIRGQGGDCFLTVMTDMTERNQLQAKFAQAQKMESIGRLAGGVAHDFNNTLQSVLSTAEYALSLTEADDPLRNELEDIRKATLRASLLTRQLLAFASKQMVETRALNINETVADLLKMLRRIIGNDIALDWQPGAELWLVHMDPSQIDSILANLCVNARDAIAGTGKISVATANAVLEDSDCSRLAGSRPGAYVTLTVRDNGCGIDAETFAHIFEPFFTTKDPGKGTGLGLASVHGAVAQNNGFIDVCSEPGRGTTFTIYLPRLSPDLAQATEKGTPPRTEGGNETILLVEDEKSIRTTMRHALEHLGYTVLTAETPHEALNLAAKHGAGIDLIVTDVTMPEMNGMDLARSVQAEHPDIRILFMSGYPSHVITQQGASDEGVHFIQKPFERQAMAAKLREVLR